MARFALLSGRSVHSDDEQKGAEPAADGVSVSPSPEEAAAEGLRWLVEEFGDGMRRSPTGRELATLLTYGLRSLETKTADVDMARLVGLGVTHRGDAELSDVDETRELNDATWEEAASLAHAVVDAFEEPATLDSVLGALVEGLRASEPTTLLDIRPDAVLALEARLEPPPKGRRPDVGDVVEIAGTPYRAVVIDPASPFGTALGILSAGDTPALVYPVFSGVEAIRRGHWPIVTHDVSLIERFPAPVCFHRADNPFGCDYGEHGAAESTDETMRLLTAQEAHDAGLDRDDFQQFVPTDWLPNWLRGRLA